ncbi:hypothetical protein GCM10010294_70940 [Streptomyces griseoloalbus]|nr:hypothetical protein GCM10010294_70940 [Streptomyces griseoloalbus]
MACIKFGKSAKDVEQNKRGIKLKHTTNCYAQAEQICHSYIYNNLKTYMHIQT